MSLRTTCDGSARHLDGLLHPWRSSHIAVAGRAAPSGVEEQPYRGGSVERTVEAIAGESNTSGRVRFQQRAAAGLLLVRWRLCTNGGDLVTAVEGLLSRRGA